MRTNTHLALHGKSERRAQKPQKTPPMESSDCYYCGEPLALLGVLGSRVHLRCVGCGMECSTVDPDALEAATEALDDERYGYEDVGGLSARALDIL